MQSTSRAYLALPETCDFYWLRSLVEMDGSTSFPVEVEGVKYELTIVQIVGRESVRGFICKPGGSPVSREFAVEPNFYFLSLDKEELPI